jgi:hypothetical protein
MSWKNIKTHFVMLGLGGTGRIFSQSYHYFFGSSFTHCTPVQKDGTITTYNDGHCNVIGWGGGDSIQRQIYDQYGGSPVVIQFQRLFRE